MKNNWFNRNQFVLKYQHKLVAYLESSGESEDDYAWLVKKSSKIQKIFRRLGLSYTYMPAFAGYMHKNYQIFTNQPSILRDRLLDDWATETLILESFNLMNNTLLRMNGDLETILESPGLKFSFGNMYTNGIKIILAFPLKLLSMFNVVENRRYNNVFNSKIFSVIGGITATLAFLATLMSIVIDWSDFIGKLP